MSPHKGPYKRRITRKHKGKSGDLGESNLVEDSFPRGGMHADRKKGMGDVKVKDLPTVKVKKKKKSK